MLPLFHLNCLHAYHCKWCLSFNFSCTSKSLVVTHAEHSCASTIGIDVIPNQLQLQSNHNVKIS